MSIDVNRRQVPAVGRLSYIRQMAVVDQISVFIENRPGELGELCGALAEEGVNIEAMMVPSGTDYGIVHLIVDRREVALQALEARSYRNYTSRVLDVSVNDEPGAFAKLAQLLLSSKIDINYAYTAIGGESGRLIVSVSNAEEAAELLATVEVA